MIRYFFIALPLLLVACQKEEESYVGGLGFEEFYPIYNDYHKRWCEGKLSEAQKELAQAKVDSSSAQDVQKVIDRFNRRLALGDYFNFRTLADLPDNLVWKDGLDEPEDSDPAAKKGGVFRHFVTKFPPTLRLFGPSSNSGMRGELYDHVQLGLVHLNRLNRSIIPGVAKQWAPSGDKRTWYFRLHEDAAYSDGVPIEARDYAISAYLRLSDYGNSPFYKQYMREEIAQITVFDKHTLAVTFPESVTELGMYSKYGGFSPAPPHFYQEFGPDYEERYNWRHQPTTGPYFVREEDIQKGVSITLTRNKDWWGNDKKFHRYRFNPDKIVWRVIRDPNKSFELFRAGQLEMSSISPPKYWYEKTEIPKVYDGYIERHWWYNDFPRPQFGLEMNLDRDKLKDRNVRLGLAHSMNFEKVIKVQFWGDYNRLPGFVDGFGEFVNPEVKPWPFSPAKAREFFAEAGFTEEGSDGILRKKDGSRLEFTLSHYAVKSYADIMSILKTEAKQAGVDLILDATTSAFTNAMDKKFELTAVAWAVQPPYFAFYEYFHSRNAYDEQGNVREKTNNVFAYNDPQMDRWVSEYRLTSDNDLKKELAHKIQKQVYEQCVFIPGWKRDFERVACWRWLRWPKTEEVNFCPPIVSSPYTHYSFWIDEEMREETLEAMRSGRVFPEVQNLVEDYRIK